jgi:predicted nucleotidyltransferase
LKTSGLVELLKKPLDHKEVKAAFIFGSVATDQDKASSDIDLMIIGNASLRRAIGWLSGIAEMVGREINPHVMSVEEYRRRLDESEHFLTSVLKSAKLFIIGNEDELEGLGR